MYGKFVAVPARFRSAGADQSLANQGKTRYFERSDPTQFHTFKFPAMQLWEEFRTTMPTVSSFPVIRHAIAGVSVSDLAQQFGTPAYVYDAGKIVERIQDLKQFDVVRYAQKACSNIAILDLCRRNGVVVDAVSAGEVHRAFKAGFVAHGTPHPIVYTSDIFDRDALELVVKHQLHVNCGSPDMIDQLGAVSPGHHITLRINPGFGHGHSQKTNTGGASSKHGIWHEQVADCLACAKRYGVVVTGIHMHIGSGTDLEHLAQVCGAMEKTVAEVGKSVTTISAGGGLPVPYKESQTYVDLPHYYQLWDATRKRLEEKLGHKLTLELEPGRYLVAESGFLITEVRAIKQSGENTFYLLDAGFNNLARPILYGSYHPMSLDVPEGRELRDVVVGGPLCESGDIFTQEEGGLVCRRQLPSAQVGDLLVLEVAGAYGFVMASNYNSKPLAAEVLIQNGQAKLIRSRQTVDDLTRGEVIPV
jgi:diaminopimelate decarboxylase